MVKNLLASAGDAGDMGSIPVLERSPGGGNGNPLQYSCLENFMDRGTWWATIQSVAKSWHLIKSQINYKSSTMWIKKRQNQFK